MLNYDTITDNDHDELIRNEQQRPSENDNSFYAGGIMDEQFENYNVNFMPATLPHPNYDDDFHNIELNSQIHITDAPLDRFNYSYVVFYLLGIATMTPWNFFITAEDVSKALRGVSFIRKNKTCLPSYSENKRPFL